MRKMNTLLATVEHSSKTTTKALVDQANQFKNNQGLFKGERNTYTAREGYLDNPGYRKYIKVQSTVNEQLDWLAEGLVKHLTDLFAIERTNSLGAKTVPLIVEGHNFGELTALELMRLKSFLTRQEWDQIYAKIPVRSDAEVWVRSTNEDFAGKEIFETPLASGTAQTTEVEEMILKDPNLDPQHLPSNYQSPIIRKQVKKEIGDYTRQMYSGEWTQTQRAELLRRRSTLLKAIIEALKVVNDVEAVDSDIKVSDIINYIHYGK